MELEEVARYRDRFGLSAYECQALEALQHILNLGRPRLKRPSVEVHPVLHLYWKLLATKRKLLEILQGATIHNLDPHAFFSKDSKQQRTDSMLKKDMISY